MTVEHLFTRGIFVSDVLRTLAQQFAKVGEVATAPFQYAPAFRQGASAELDELAILSADGVWAFNLVSRNTMMQGFLHMEGGDKLFLFICQFHSSPSTLLGG